MQLTGAQKKYLRGLAHGLKPTVLIGQNGLTEAVAAAINDALTAHELIKIKFVENKGKERKNGLLIDIRKQTDCRLVGTIGHTATLYRRAAAPEDRKISLP